MAESPTDSHALAQTAPEDSGAVGSIHTPEVQDLGWNQHPDKVAKPLIGGIDNEDLWLLIRRFNKQMNHVKEYAYPLPGKLDLNVVDDEEFSAGKLRASVERLYITVGLAAISVVKHVARLRSWRELRRTSAFCAVYFVAWVVDLLVPTLVAAILLLILYPPSRTILFPPAPLALIDPVSGGVQKPRAGILGSTDTATGSPEQHKGEAAEAEAAHFVTSLASVAIASPSSNPPQSDVIQGDKIIPDPSDIISEARNAQTKSEAGNPAKGVHDKAKAPMEEAVWTQLRPIFHAVGAVTDTYERIANALEPTPPFHPYLHRLRLAVLLVPLFLGSLYVTAYMFVKGVAFGIGFAFFGDPIIRSGASWLNRKVPHWEKLLELRNTILKGVPTNAQLAITLLRMGEANKAPLPPPPVSQYPPTDESVELSDDNLRALGEGTPLDATPEELEAALQPDTAPKMDSPGGIEQKSKPNKLVGVLKKSVRGVVHTALGADRVKATAGSDASRRRLGVVPRQPRELMLTGPVDFACRYEGKRGRVYVVKEATIPSVAFALGAKGSENEALKPVWSIAVGDIKELRKVGGFGWKARLVVGWALEKEVADGLEIVTRRGDKVCVTAMVLRDELFNRLVAMGGQKWEAW
ncbi:hypothetical protein FB45DRAFT_979639 [Roridomyces roridus]|uniref:Uncharacterized protein n=1 Tax=Roridomyces roridus TaxID=1738132 RepID=A0AAD7FLV2_9AGAR|nr:hypothetical protein FB45DRAFT_979639 [Roridomyces roridus]